MLYLQHNQGSMYKRLVAIGIPHIYITPFIQEVVKWETCSGVEWTIKRLKSLKVDIIRHRAHLPLLTWVRKNRKGQWSGVIGSLLRFSEKSEKSFSKVIQVFMAYTFYIHGSLTDGQKEKFLKGINPESIPVVDPQLLKKLGQTTRKYIRCCKSLLKEPRPLVTYRGSHSRKSPRMFGQSSVPQSDRILDDLQILNTAGGAVALTRYKRILKPLLRGVFDFSSVPDHLHPDTMCPGIYGGEIHFIQEPGGKLRSVASPLRIWQEATRPLGELLYQTIRSLPWDCTHDQEQAAQPIISSLAQGRVVHSVDLSSATDLFPLELQIEVLQNLLVEDDRDYIDLFREISRARWKSPLGVLQWTKGQPLGLFPSFGLFSLTHGLLLLTLLGHDWSGEFYVVGDDVVILDDSLHRDYLRVLDEIGSPWSPDKSLDSSRIAEFAGKIYTSSGVYPQLKWRNISDDSFLDIMRLTGPRGRVLLSSRQKKVYDQVAHLCEPIGLNQSLPGDNLFTMIQRTLNFYQPEVQVLGYLMGLSRTVNHNLIDQSYGINHDEIMDIIHTFDEKVKSVMEKILLSRWEVAQSIGLDCFSLLPSVLGLQPGLPLETKGPSRRTTLLRYEWLLKLQQQL